MIPKPTPPKKQPHADRDRFDRDADETSDADIIAEQIEAGYDIQADAATKALVDDPASSSDGGEPTEG